MNETNGTKKKEQFALNDRVNLRILREAIEENLDEWAREVGLKITTGTISYEPDGSGAKVQVKVEAPNADGVMVPQYEKDFIKYWRMLSWEGVEEKHLHSTFENRGTTYEIVGLRPKASKNSLVIKRVSDGKTFHASPRFARIGKPEPIVGGLQLVPPPSRTK